MIAAAPVSLEIVMAGRCSLLSIRYSLALARSTPSIHQAKNSSYGGNKVLRCAETFNNCLTVLITCSRFFGSREFTSIAEKLTVQSILQPVADKSHAADGSGAGMSSGTANQTIFDRFPRKRKGSAHPPDHQRPRPGRRQHRPELPPLHDPRRRPGRGAGRGPEDRLDDGAGALTRLAGVCTNG